MVDFSNGTNTTLLTTTLVDAETPQITVTDGTIVGIASSSVTVNPGVTTSYAVSAASPPETAGTAFNVAVTAEDADGNTNTTDSTTSVTMTSNHGNVQFDSNGNGTFNESGDNIQTLTAGAFTISAKDNVAESTTITATDGNGTNGVSDSITVNPGAVDAGASTVSPTTASITADGSTTRRSR